MSRGGGRCLVIGLDGATFDLLDPLMQAGDLPFLRSLASAHRARLTSVFPPKTIPAWYSFATGQDPGELGIFGFTEPDGGPGKSRIVQTFRPAEAVWDRLSRHGVTVGVLNFPLRAGYPINGFVVPGMLTERPTTYPEGLRGDLETALGEPYLPELPAYRESDRAHWVELATRGATQHAAAAEYLVGRYRPDFLFVLFRETDRVQHQHWGELQQPLARIPADLRAFYRAVDAACARVDAAFRAIGGPATTLVISDHGHGAARSDFFTNRWLAEEGYLVFRNGGGHSVRRRALSTLLLASDRLGLGSRLIRPIADRLRGTAHREWVTKAIAGETSFEAMAAAIDWDRTVAFSYPVPEGIYLNRYNASLTDAQKAAVTDEIRRKLEAYREARIEVLDPKRIYRGQNLAQGPALLMRIDDLATEPRMDFSYPRPMLRQRPEYFYGSGVHRMDGVFLLRTDDPNPPALPDALSLLDVAPTILDLMGRPIPPTMRGSSAYAPPARAA